MTKLLKDNVVVLACFTVIEMCISAAQNQRPKKALGPVRARELFVYSQIFRDQDHSIGMISSNSTSKISDRLTPISRFAGRIP